MYTPSDFAKQFHPKYRDAAELTKLIEEGGYADWIGLYKDKMNFRKGQMAAGRPYSGAYWVSSGTGTDDCYQYTANPFFVGVDPMGNQLPYTEGWVETRYESNEVALFRAMAGEHDCCSFNLFGPGALNPLTLPLAQNNMEKGDYSLYRWHERLGHAVSGFVQTYNVDPEIGMWLRTPEFRKAMSYSLDREAVKQVNYLGLGTVWGDVPHPSVSPWAPSVETATRYTVYDPEKAKAMLDALGLVDTDGDGFRNRIGILGGGTGNLEIYSETPSAEDNTVSAKMVEDAWAAVGIKLNWTTNNDYYKLLRDDGMALALGAGICYTPFGGSGSGGSCVMPSSPDGAHMAPAIGKWVSTAGTCEGWEPERCMAPTGPDPNFLPLAPDLSPPTWPVDATGTFRNLYDRYIEGTTKYPVFHPEHIRIGKEMFELYGQQAYRHGTVCCTPENIVLKRNNFRNVPKSENWYYHGNYKEVYYFEDGLDNLNNPGNRSKKYKSESFVTGLTY